MGEFDARGYWERRLEETYAIDGVGYAGLGTAFNAWMYRVRRHVFMRALGGLATRASTLRVLDVGSGTGFYADRWHELGVPSITGADLTEAATARLSQRYPQDRFVRFDVGGAAVPLEPESFDAISAMDVLFHIVDDASFRRAFANLFTLLTPGGIFAFSDNFVHGASERVAHQASRSLEHIEAIVREAGFEVLGRRPMFVLLNTPVDSRNRALNVSWRAIETAAARSAALGGALGALLYPVELALVSRLREGPSTELMLCRRRPA